MLKSSSVPNFAFLDSECSSKNPSQNPILLGFLPLVPANRLVLTRASPILNKILAQCSGVEWLGSGAICCSDFSFCKDHRGLIFVEKSFFLAHFGPTLGQNHLAIKFGQSLAINLWQFLWNPYFTMRSKKNLEKAKLGNQKQH